jgi:hypothetical protein
MSVMAAAMVLLALQGQDNPQFEYWANCKTGSWVRHRMEFENQGQKMEFESVTRLLEVTPEKVVVETMRRLKTGDKGVDSPPQKSEIKAKDPQSGKTISERVEEITVAGKTLSCRYYEVEQEASDKKSKTTIKSWMSKEIPGGAAKSEITSPQLKGPVKVVALEWEKK